MSDEFAGCRVILHADMDAFYASVEQRDRPELVGKPVIIGAQGPRGVVAAASYEARAFGVRSAMPGFEAHRLCPHGVFLGGDMKKYASVSRQIHQVFEDFTDQIEPLALDEAFLDVTGSVGLLGTPELMGRELKRRILAQTQLNVSVGIAQNKLVAKIACSQGKPNGLRLVPPGAEAALLAPLPLRALFGIGPKTAERLEKSGFQRVGDLAKAPLPALIAVFGRHAEAMRERARGIDQRPVVADRQAKSIGEEATFPDDVSSRTRLQSALAAHSETVAARARRANVVGDTVTVKLKFSRRVLAGRAPLAPHDLFQQKSKQARLPASTNDGAIILAEATRLLQKLDPKESVRLLGVSLSGLSSSDGPSQLGLFDSSSSHIGLRSSAKLGRALDAINEKYGEGAIGRAAERPEKVTASSRMKLGDRTQEGKSQNSDETDRD